MNRLTVAIEIEVEVEYSHHKAVRGHRDKYGAPEEPDEEASNEIMSIKYNGKEIKVDHALDAIQEAVDEDYEDQQADCE